MKQIANRNARQVVTDMLEFKGSNTFGVWENPACYVVYSYGKHFPMYVFDVVANMWFGNYDKYSSSTSKHQSQLRPSAPVIYKNTHFLNNIIYDGIAIATDKGE
jgi:hypothetical protein